MTKRERKAQPKGKVTRGTPFALAGAPTPPSCSSSSGSDDNKLSALTSATTSEHDWRHGCPASVVDPLLSLFMSLRRLQDSVVHILESVGVPRDQLEAYGYTCAERKEPEMSGRTMEDGESFLNSLSPLDRYFAAHISRRNNASNMRDVLCGLSRDTRETCIDAILRWMDEKSPYNVIADVALSRRKLIARLLAAEEHHDAALAANNSNHDDNNSDMGSITTTTPIIPTPRLNHEKAECHSRPPEEHKIVLRRHWQHYAARLKMACRAERAAAKRMCSRDIGKGLSCAKWVKIENKQETEIATPSVVSLQENYDELTLAKDTLAKCQVNITKLLSALDDAIDEYVEQVHKVSESEESFCSNVRLAKWESEALMDLSRRITSAADLL